MNGKRYLAVDGSGHRCCFDAAVVDTTKPIMIGGKHYDGRFSTVCETFEREDAEKIAKALNAMEQTQ